MIDLRWVGKTEVLQKLYIGSLMSMVSPKIVGGEAKSYGFRKGCSVNEVGGAIRELLRGMDTWGSDGKGLIDCW